MMKPVSIAVATLLVGGAGLVAPVHAETLSEALVSAYQSNPTLQARRLLGRATDEQVPQALSGWRPTVTLEGSAGYEKVNYDQKAYTDKTLNPLSVGVTVQQNIFQGFRTVAAVDQAEANVAAERAALKSVEQTVLLDVVTAYFTLIRDQAVLELNKNNEEVLQRQLEAAQDRFRVGEITRTDVAQAESRLAAAVASRIAAEGTLATTRANYEKVVGHSPTQLETPRLEVKLPQTIEDAVDVARRSNPDITSAEYTWDAAKASIRDARGRLLPTVNAKASVSWDQESSTENLETTTVGASVVVSMPLYEGGATYSAIRDAKHRAGQRRVQVDEQRDTVIEKVSSTWQSLESAKARVTSYESQIEAATIALDGVKREAQVGSRTTLDVLDAEQELLQARVNLAGAQRDTAVYTYQLLAAIGQMTADTLALNTPLHDPQRHYDDVRGQWLGGNAWADRDAALGQDKDITDDVTQENISIDSGSIR